VSGAMVEREAVIAYATKIRGVLLRQIDEIHGEDSLVADEKHVYALAFVQRIIDGIRLGDHRRAPMPDSGAIPDQEQG
jgi:hypothetical protein